MTDELLLQKAKQVTELYSTETIIELVESYANQLFKGYSVPDKEIDKVRVVYNALLILLKQQQADIKFAKTLNALQMEELQNARVEIARLNKCVKSEDEVRAIANATIQAGIKIIKSEAIKDFVDRVCEGRVSNDPVVISVKAELKEVVGEQ